MGSHSPSLTPGTDWAPSDLVSLQSASRDGRGAWPMNAPRNWVDLFSSVHVLWTNLKPRSQHIHWTQRVVHGSILCDPIQPNPSADWPNPTKSNPTQPTTSGKTWTPTQPNTTNNGAYSLVVTYFYTQNLSRNFSQPSINLFVFFAGRALSALTWSF